MRKARRIRELERALEDREKALKVLGWVSWQKYAKDRAQIALNMARIQGENEERRRAA